MSSILRALKKLENEPRHLEENQPLDSKFVPLAETEPQRTFRSISMLVLGGGIVCGLVVLAGLWLLSEKPQSPPPQISQSSSRPDESRAPEFDSNKAQTVSEKPVMKTPVTPKKVEQVRLAEPTGLEEPALRTIKEEYFPAAEVQTPKEAIPTQEFSSEKSSEKIEKPAEKPVVASGSIPISPQKTVEPEIPKLKDPGMKLQAITWSKAPQKRITVINNRILREGEMVSGYIIKTINTDDVVLTLDGEKWKLLFR